AESLTWILGNHTTKFGAEFNHVFADQIFGFNQFGVFGNSSSTPTSTAPPATNTSVLFVLATAPGKNRFDSSSATYARQLGNLKLAFSSNETALFAQDSWRVRPNFTLNYGLRWEGQFNPAPEANNESLVSRIRGFRFPSGHSVDPTNIPDSTNQI